MKTFIASLVLILSVQAAHGAGVCNDMFAPVAQANTQAHVSDKLASELENLRRSEVTYEAVKFLIVEKLTAAGIAHAPEVADALLSFENQSKSAREIVEGASSKVVSLKRKEDLANLVMQTDRLEIRALGPEKVEEALLAWGDPQTAQMSGDYIDRGTALQILSRGQTTLENANARHEPYINFGIYLDGKLVGMSQVASGQEGTIFNSKKGAFGEKWASVSYHLRPDVWGKGIATEAATRLVRFAFETLKVDGLHGEAIDTNKGSLAILKKLGFENFMNFPGLPHGTSHFFMNKAMFESKSHPLQNAG